MSASSFRHLIAVLDGDREQLREVLEQAIELADAEHARLTLAKTTNPGWLAECACAFPALAGLPPPARTEEEARRVLAQAAERVPASIPLTTVLLGRSTVRALAKLLRSGRYDLLVGRAQFLRGSLGLRVLLRRLSICTLAVCSDPPAGRVRRAPEGAGTRALPGT